MKGEPSSVSQHRRPLPTLHVPQRRFLSLAGSQAARLESAGGGSHLPFSGILDMDTKSPPPACHLVTLPPPTACHPQARRPARLSLYFSASSFLRLEVDRCCKSWTGLPGRGIRHRRSHRSPCPRGCPAVARRLAGRSFNSAVSLSVFNPATETRDSRFE